MRKKHRATLRRIFQTPPPTGIRWAEVETMLKSNDVEVVERAGSRVLLRRGRDRIVIHRPHPEPEIGRSTVRDIAAFLKAVGLEP
jgi:HicA toxin of bacterial toxin-antitoxin,